MFRLDKNKEALVLRCEEGEEVKATATSAGAMVRANIFTYEKLSIASLKFKYFLHRTKKGGKKKMKHPLASCTR